MRCRRVARHIVATIAAGLVLTATLSPAAADPVCQRVDLLTGVCVIRVEDSPPDAEVAPASDDGPKDTGDGATCYIDPGERDPWTGDAGPIACSSEHGFWSNTLQCYIKLASPQPAATDPAWSGHDPAAGGAIYTCYRPVDGVSANLWFADSPTPAAAGPSPREVAEMAVEEMNLRAIEIGIAPEPTPGSMGLVGMPVWMWARDPGPSTTGPTTATASADGITVTATASIHRITWSMGDGTEIPCDGAGTPYTMAYGESASPDCGHTYSTTSAGQSGGKFTVTATSDWVVTWEGAGQTGTIRLDPLQRSVQIAIGEAQVLVTS